MWFTELTGIRELSPEQVRSQLHISGSLITFKVNGVQLRYGKLEIPSLKELREKVERLSVPRGRIKLTEVVGDVGLLHTRLENEGSLFQVASQFNLLEMVSPKETPEQGINRYEYDHTQGPACAIACGAGTIFRNYYVQLENQIGQTSSLQIDTLLDLGNALGNQDNQLWTRSNGYALCSKSGLDEISKLLDNLSDLERDKLRSKLRVGIQWDTQVTRGGCEHLVSQVYASALPVAYSEHSNEQWSEFAKLILEAAYEATLLVAVINAHRTGKNGVYLTLLGGGAFGNSDDWIFSAISRAVNLLKNIPLEINVVSYGSSKSTVREWVSSTNQILNDS